MTISIGGVLRFCRELVAVKYLYSPPHYPLPDFYPGPFLGVTGSFLGDPGLAPSGSSIFKANCAVSSREGKHESARSTVQHSAGAQVAKATSKCTRQAEPYLGRRETHHRPPSSRNRQKKKKNIEEIQKSSKKAPKDRLRKTENGPEATKKRRRKGGVLDTGAYHDASYLFRAGRGWLRTSCSEAAA